MGSLMAGWDSPVHDPKYVALQRNRSFTKEEIDAFWKSRKSAKEQPHQTTSIPLDEKKYTRSTSLPQENKKREETNFMEINEERWEKLIDTHGWWTRSNWAFLNEPPASEKNGNSYISQFHVANLSKA